MHGKHTRPITEAVALYLVVCTLALLAGMRWLAELPGIQVALLAFLVAGFVQTYWLWRGRRGLPSTAG